MELAVDERAREIVDVILIIVYRSQDAHVALCAISLGVKLIFDFQGAGAHRCLVNTRYGLRCLIHPLQEYLILVILHPILCLGSMMIFVLIYDAVPLTAISFDMRIF